MPAGRPREHDRNQVALDMIEWARRDDSINLCKFAALYNPPIAPSILISWTKTDPEFHKAYETAKQFLGFRREEMLNKDMLHVKAYDLNATTYDPYLKLERMEMSSFDASLRKETETKPTEINIRVAHDGLGSGIGVSAQTLPNTVHKSPKQRN